MLKSKFTSRMSATAKRFFKEAPSLKRKAAAPAPAPAEKRSVLRRLNDYIDALDDLDASLLTTASSEPFPLADMLCERLEEGNDDEDELVIDIDGARLLDFPLSDSEFSVCAEDFAPLLAAMHTVAKECVALSERLATRIEDGDALGRFVDTPAPAEKAAK
jgi:hypothetical protein